MIIPDGTLLILTDNAFYRYVIPDGISPNDGMLPGRAFISIESMRKISTNLHGRFII
jgi:hypothetical protein